MDCFTAMFTAIFLLFTTASSAPHGHSPHDACAGVRKSSLEFNRITKEAAKNGSNTIKHFSTPLAWMEARDMCDPGTLRHTPGPCIEKILDVLTLYKSFLETVAEFESCSIADEVKPVLDHLYQNMSKCVKSRTGYHPQNVNRDRVETPEWQKMPLCEYTMERLFSFSILTARVFSVGDPSNHAEATAPKCRHSK